MHIRPSYHRDEYQHGRAPDGFSAFTGPEVTVEQEEDGSGVTLHLDPLPTETLEDRMVSRTFTAKVNSAEAFSYLFFSLFRRYGVPILAQSKKAVWGDVAATITLQRGIEGLTIRYEVLR